MLFNPTILLSLLALASASPTPLTPRQGGVETTWLAIVPGGSCSDGGSTGVAGNFTLTSPSCSAAGVSSYLVGQLPDVDCKITLYNGFDCVAGTETSVIDVPAGNGDTCFFSGSFQGICSHCPQISYGYTCAS